MIYKNLIFDGDNTLWECSQYYREQKEAFAKFSSERTGFDTEFCKTLLEKIDVEFTTQPEAFGRDRYPRAFSATSAVLDTMKGHEVDRDAAKKAYDIGDAVFVAEYRLYDGVREMLDTMKADGRQLFLYSKGDLEVQERKIKINKLNDLFPKFRTYLVLKKSSKELQRIMADHNLDELETLVIGDSLRDEISCATTLGIDSLLVPTGDKWGYENVNITPTFSLGSHETVANLITALPELEKEMKHGERYAKV